MSHLGFLGRTLWVQLLLCVCVGSPWLAAQDKPTALPQIEAALPPIEGVENLRQVAPGILSGSQPEGVAAFRELSLRGVKVIISVDGAAPNVELAHQFGLRYVHVPIGYDRIEPQSRADLVEATKAAGGPVFLHCHHGKHRGPAAAAYCGMAVGTLTAPQALNVLKVAGTKPDDTGLWDAVRNFEPPQLPAGPLVESAVVAPLTSAMVRIDHHWAGIDQQVKAGQVADWWEFTREALLLSEEFRELPRMSASMDAGFNDRMETAIKVAEELHSAAEKQDLVLLRAAHLKVLKSCTDCHASYRDR